MATRLFRKVQLINFRILTTNDSQHSFPFPFPPNPFPLPPKEESSGGPLAISRCRGDVDGGDEIERV